MDIELRNINFSYNSTFGDQPVLRDINLRLASGECAAIIGHSGSGKSTLAQHLNGLLKPKSGQILIEGKPLSYSPEELRHLRRRIGLVFQFPEAQIFEKNVFDEIAFAARQWGIPREEIKPLVKTALHSVGLTDNEMPTRNPLRLSGGEARLVSIASLEVVDPDWLILDEPTLGLDFAHYRCIRDLIRQRCKQSRGVLLISHDLDLVLATCPRTLILEEGKLQFDGKTQNLFFSDFINADYGIVAPESVAIWKILKHFKDQLNNDNNFPPFKIEDLNLWIQDLAPPQRREICIVLKQYLAEVMLQSASLTSK